MTLLESLETHPFAPQTVEHAQQEFSDALSETQAIETSIAKFSGITGLIPIYGPRLEAAIHLSALAVDVSQAGVNGCNLLGLLLSHYHNPLNGTSSPLSAADFKVMTGDFQKVSNALGVAIYEAAQVQPGDVTFDAHLAKLVAEFQAKIPTLREILAGANQLLPSLPALLGIGSPAHYLVEILDSTELRPGGGFIGNYGILTVQGGRTLPLRITDVDLLDRPFEFAGHTIPYPATYSWFTHYLSPYSWSLRDSNLDADFPTSARDSELIFEREGGNVALQGVIAITPFLIEQVLEITGPISVPEYHETITAQNLVARIHYHQLGNAGEGPDYIPSADGHSSLRKRFTELLGEHLLTRFQQLSSSALPAFVQAFVHGVETKNVQIYLNASAAEDVLLRNHLASAIESPGGDSLFVVDANVAGDKANSFITSTVNDQVTLDSTDNAIHHLILRYAWTISGKNYGSSLYKDYLRIYVPPGSTLSQQDGWQPQGTSAAFGSEVWAGSFTLVYGQARTITLIWISYGVASKDANGWHYQYLLQRQSGIQRTLELQVTPPPCVVAISRWGGFAPGKTHMATLTETWDEDIDAGLAYAC